MDDDRVNRLLDKAEAAIDRNDTDQAEHYASLASLTRYIRAKDAKSLHRMVYEPSERDNDGSR